MIVLQKRKKRPFSKKVRKKIDLIYLSISISYSGTYQKRVFYKEYFEGVLVI